MEKGFHLKLSMKSFTLNQLIHEKYFINKKLEFEKRKVELRLGYYILGEKPRMKNKWVWGQFTPQMPLIDFKRIINKAKKKGFV